MSSVRGSCCWNAWWNEDRIRKSFRSNSVSFLTRVTRRATMRKSSGFNSGQSAACGGLLFEWVTRFTSERGLQQLSHARVTPAFPKAVEDHWHKSLKERTAVRRQYSYIHVGYDDDANRTMSQLANNSYGIQWLFTEVSGPHPESCKEMRIKFEYRC